MIFSIFALIGVVAAFALFVLSQRALILAKDHVVTTLARRLVLGSLVATSVAIAAAALRVESSGYRELGELGHCFILAGAGLFAAALFDQVVAVVSRGPSLARWWALAGLVAIFGAVGVMEYALIAHDFSLLYVQQNNATFTPFLYSVTGMWSALEGSILLWTLLLSVAVVAMGVRYRARAGEPYFAWANALMLVVVVFFLALMAAPANPFVANLAAAHATGEGPNALLQDNPLVAIHPPLLYLGFVGFTIPFAFAMAALITGRVSEPMPQGVRRFTVLSWGALSVGIVLGAWWSYQVLGWGGFWGWDPVENAALLPWLTGTAYLHSSIVQDRRGLFRAWNISLAITTFALTILGTFFTRSGVLESVHSFSASSLGPLLIGFFGLIVVAAAGLIAWRGDRLRSPVGVDQPLSREGLFVANNILFIGFAVVVLLGTVFPLLYQAINGNIVTVGPPYFAAVGAPAAVLLLVLMATAPVMGWRRGDPRGLWDRLRPVAWTSLAVVFALLLAGVHKPLVLAAYLLATMAAGAAVRSVWAHARAAHQRGEGRWRALLAPGTGGMVVHLGIVLLAVGIVTSTSYAVRREVVLEPGQSTVVDGETLTFVHVARFDTALRYGTELVVEVDATTRLTPAVTTFRGREGQTVGTPAIDSNLLRDVYLTFDAYGVPGGTTGAQVDGALKPGEAAIGVTVEPLLSWLWLGGLIVGLGSALAIWRRPRQLRSTP